MSRGGGSPRSRALSVRTYAAPAEAGHPLQGDKVVVVTGAARGLGLEFTRQLLERGNTVCALCRSASPALQELQQGPHGAALHVVDSVDLLDESCIEEAAAAVGCGCLSDSSAMHC